MFIWNKSLSVGDLTLDEQHQVFFDKINTFESGKTGEQLKFLADYARKHFAEEEQYMATHQYPELKLHAEIHKEFITRLMRLIEDYQMEGSTPELAREVAQFCGEWLTGHITNTDLNYKRFIEEKK